MYAFGKRSKEKLVTADTKLQKAAERALSLGVMDFSIIEAHRSVKRQKELYDQGKSMIDGETKKGKHNYEPSLAIDIIPYPAVINDVNVWSDKQRFCVLAGIMFAAASLENIKLRWGGDWDGDGNNADSSFHDLPHFEVLEEDV